MRKLVIAAVVLFAASTSQATTFLFGGNLYFLTNAAEDWNAAEAEAVADGGHLASIHSALQNAALASFFITGPTSSSVSTKSPITIVSAAIFLKATHEPSANVGLTSTSPTFTCKSVRGKPIL